MKRFLTAIEIFLISVLLLSTVRRDLQNQMERLYQETSSLLQQAHFGMGRLERAKDEREAHQISQSITEQLRVIEKNYDQLVILVNKEAPARRHIVRMKVDQLKTDSQNIHYAISTIFARLSARWRAASEREELLHQRFRPNEATTLSMEDHELQMHDRLSSSNRQVDDLISQGVAVLENLRSQHMNLRGVRKKILDVGSAVSYRIDIDAEMATLRAIVSHVVDPDSPRQGSIAMNHMSDGCPQSGHL